MELKVFEIRNYWAKYFNQRRLRMEQMKSQQLHSQNKGFFFLKVDSIFEF